MSKLTSNQWQRMEKWEWLQRRIHDDNIRIQSTQ